MIRFENLTKSYRIRGIRKLVIDNLDLELPSGKSLGLLGRNGAGKSTLLQLIAGTMRPDSGRVIRHGSVSWPVGFAGSFHPEMTGAENVRFIARIYGVDSDELVDFVEEFAELDKHYHMPVRSYSSGMKSRLTFGASMGIRFDTYLVDEVTAVGDVGFRRKSKRIFKNRMKDSSAIMVSHEMQQMRTFCDAGILLEQGHLYYFDEIDEAIAAYQSVMAETRT